MNGKISYVNGLKHVILLKWKYYQKQSMGSIESLPKLQWFFFYRARKTHPKIYIDSQGTLNSEN